jgi:hypothetical protein
VIRLPENVMNQKSTDAESLAILQRLVTDIGTPQLLSLIAQVAEEHANELLRQGASPQAARFAREAEILSRASEAILE